MNHKQPLPGTRSCAPEQPAALILLLDVMGYHGRSVESIDLFGRSRVFWWSFSTRGLSAVRRSCFGNTLPDYAWCFGCSFDGANLGIRRAKMEGVPMADTRDAAPQGSAEFASFVVTALAHMADLQVDPMVALGDEIALQWSSTNSTEKCPPSPAPPSD